MSDLDRLKAGQIPPLGLDPQRLTAYTDAITRMPPGKLAELHRAEANALSQDMQRTPQGVVAAWKAADIRDRYLGGEGAKPMYELAVARGERMGPVVAYAVGRSHHALNQRRARVEQAQELRGRRAEPKTERSAPADSGRPSREDHQRHGPRMIQTLQQQRRAPTQGYGRHL